MFELIGTAVIADAVTRKIDVRGRQSGPDGIVGGDERIVLGEEEAEPADEEDADGDE